MSRTLSDLHGRAAAVVVALSPLLVLVGSASSARAADPATVTVVGDLVQVQVDGVEGEASPVVSMLEVGTTLVALPTDDPVEGSTGDAVTVTVRGAGTLRGADAVESAGPADVDIDVDATAGAPAVASDDGVAAAAAPAVHHSLVIVPVYWSAQAPSGPTVATLLQVGQQTAQYWSDQSGSRITTTAQVMPWVRVAAPSGCSTGAGGDMASLMSSALAAAGVGQPAATEHVLVYFPTTSACAWAGLGSIGGPYLWVNGYPNVEVFAHEMGHNLGLGHANSATCQGSSGPVPLLLPVGQCTTTEYGDRQDVMGSSFLVGHAGNLNAGLADALGLVQVVTASAAAPVTVTLAPAGSSGGIRAVAVPVEGGTVYVDFRPQSAVDSRYPGLAGVQVHLVTWRSPGYWPVSYLLDMASVSGQAVGGTVLTTGTWSVPGTALAVRVVSSPGAALATVEVASAPEAARFVTKLYQDLFGRDPDGAGLQAWVSLLAGGVPRGAVADSITASDEFRLKLVDQAYEHYLGRGADEGGRMYWLARMRSGATIDQLENGFVSSAEAYQVSGGDAGWVRFLYRAVLDRDCSAAEVQYWTGMLTGLDRAAVARGFLLSAEHLTTVVDQQYVLLLHRGIDADGAAFWVRQIQGGVRLESIVAAIASGAEYAARA